MIEFFSQNENKFIGGFPYEKNRSYYQAIQIGRS
jgi:hypothetical protein